MYTIVYNYEARLMHRILVYTRIYINILGMSNLVYRLFVFLLYTI